MGFFGVENLLLVKWKSQHIQLLLVWVIAIRMQYSQFSFNAFCLIFLSS